MRARFLAPVSLLAAAALSVGVLAQPAATASTKRLVLAKQISKVELRDLRNLPKTSSVLVSNPVTGEVLYSRNAQAPLLTASTMKLVTAVVALQTFSPNYRIKTRVFFDVEQNRLTLVGSGDPTLSRAGLKVLAERVRAALPDLTAADLYVDDSLFPAPRPAAGWLNGYIPRNVNPVTALPLMGAKTSHPVSSAAKAFSDSLKTVGIAAAFKGAAPASGTEVALRSSLPLEVIVGRMLIESDNNFAEHLFRLSAAASGKYPTWGAAKQYAFAQLETLGVDTTGIVLADGSGLSRNNRLSAKALVQLLNITRSAAHPKLARILDNDLLAIAGLNGTLKNRFKSAKTKCAAGQIEAKTGTLKDTIGLAGFVHTPEGLASFAILVNGGTRSQQNALRQDVDWVISALAIGC